mgnify:FL=1|tara:strand:- start:514 stop:1248 length:735 start_codon:yes stop_codon:yes gene_type:complete
MSTLPLNLIVFSTTMGHGGRHTYQDCLNKLHSQIDLSIFSNKLLHLKSRDGEEDIAYEIKSFCSYLDIRVLESKEDIVHHSENHLSHSAGYFKDIYTAYSDLEIRKQKYSLWLEDDWIFNSKVCLEEVFKDSLKFLDDNPNQLCVRFNGSKDFGEPEGNHLVENDNIYTQAINYTKYGPTFTFQPNINRTTEIFIAWKSAQNYLDKLGSYHCELMSGDLLKGATNSRTPFSFFNTNKIYSEHIG